MMFIAENEPHQIKFWVHRIRCWLHRILIIIFNAGTSNFGVGYIEFLILGTSNFGVEYIQFR